MNEVIENILSRRSIRKYLEDQISDEDLSIILEAAKHAPSGGNSQTWHFTVLQNKEKLMELNKYVRAAFEKLEVNENTYRSIRSGKVAAKNEAYSFYYNAPTLIIVTNERNYGNAMADSACAIENMLLASNALNLGSCYVNQLTWFGDDKDLRKLLIELGVPETHKVWGAIIVGYRDGDMPKAAKRKENTVTIIK
ncbi:nitroreductase [Clostridium sp. YIM B02551]|uniref:nitroreductase family protein n=1 Tax=Clostridium sp. YIM B02551 TaxID=2910679 RepID=UPI001EEAFB58|nr:nitroreductase [Clostridium sp. YIM B02551]